MSYLGQQVSVGSAKKDDKELLRDTEDGNNAWDTYQSALDAVNSHGNFQYSNQAQLDLIMNSILNREDFSYDLKEDAFYQQYKDKFLEHGKRAMQDTIGQASSMTGGYGNSYATTAGNQAYQASLEQLNDVIPELYQMAYDQHNMERQELYNQFDVLQSDYDRAYREHTDEYNKLMDALDYHQEQSNTGSPVVSDDKTTTPTDESGDTSNISASIRNKLKEFTTNKARENYLWGLKEDGTIDEDQMNALYAEYMNDVADLADRRWQAGKDGGVNWLWGIDNNATVKDQYDNEYRLDDLVDMLVEEGMSKSEAKSYVKDLQKQFGLG